MKDADVAYLAGRLEQGGVVLFTGAGFSRSATNSSGGNLPLGSELAAALWPIAFPGEEYDGESRLADVYDVAVRVARNATRDLLKELLTVQRGDVPSIYRDWFSFPWRRHYTVNVDNLDVMTGVDYSLPREIESVTALREIEPIVERNKLQSVHLNGRVDDFPEVTFSDLQYGERTSSPDPWYRALVTDLSSRCVVFVGTALDEPSLWQHIELRRTKGKGHKEQRPRGFLVSPSLTLAREKMLEQFNIVWVPMDQEQFVEEVLGQLREQANAGLGVLAAQSERTRTLGQIEPVNEVRTVTPSLPREYLLGKEPEWGDLGPDGFAVVREFERDLARVFDDSGKRILFLTGTAGAGKSTTLRRLGLEYDTAGKRTYWLPTTTTLSLTRVRTDVAAAKAEILLIDDVDAFGATTPSFLQGLLQDSEDVRLVVSLRSSRFRRLGLEDQLEDDLVEVTVPLLGDGDIDLLLDALERANRLGELRGMSRAQQAGVFRSKAGRELLVAMIEATSGELFEKRIGAECSDLGAALGYQYAAACLATAFRLGLTRDEILDVADGEPNAALNDFKYLVDHHLLVEREGLFWIRHRLIAERALDHYRDQGQLADVIESLLWVIAARVGEHTHRYSRERKLLVLLLSHEFLIRQNLTQSQARSVYDTVENLLAWDSHYWLQRGSFEVERGDVNSAKNFLDQARSLAPDDFMVRTEWAYMTIKRAASSPETADAQAQVDEALEELEEAIRVRGGTDSYPYHVLGSQGLSWARRAPMDTPVRRQFLAHILAIVKEGLHRHPKKPELVQLVKDVEYDYLMTAAIDETAPSASQPPSGSGQS